MKFKFLYLFLFSLIFTISCKEDSDVNTLPDKFEEYEDDYYVHKETVKILKDELLSFVRLDNTDESVLVFDANTPKDILPKKGDIIFIDRNEKFITTLKADGRIEEKFIGEKVITKTYSFGIGDNISSEVIS